jgi:hypothetical protein
MGVRGMEHPIFFRRGPAQGPYGKAYSVPLFLALNSCRRVKRPKGIWVVEQKYAFPAAMMQLFAVYL